MSACSALCTAGGAEWAFLKSALISLCMFNLFSRYYVMAGARAFQSLHNADAFTPDQFAHLALTGKHVPNPACWHM
jgi:hypothetical protein